MIKRIINIKDYWTIIIFVNIDYNRYDIIEEELLNLNASYDIIDEIYDTISFDYNKAFKYTNPRLRTSLIGINKTTDIEEMLDSIVHEVDHVQADICEYYDVPLNSEDAAYLIGYIIKLLYKSSCL